MSIAIGFDLTSGVLVIGGNGVFPPRSLTVWVSPVLPGDLQISDLAGRSQQIVRWQEVTDLGKTYTPASLEDALGYLQGEFAKVLPVGEVSGTPTVAGVDLVQGQPVAVSRTTGQLLLARADTYVLGFVTGLATADTVRGFTNQPARGTFTLPDWTAQTGAPTLLPGQPYFLGRVGGLTTTPDFSSSCIARVGVALTPSTLVVDPTTPILL